MPYKDPQGYHKEGIKGRDQMRSPIRCSSLADSFEAPPTHNKVCEWELELVDCDQNPLISSATFLRGLVFAEFRYENSNLSTFLCDQ
jgi:hypothetical protein